MARAYRPSLWIEAAAVSVYDAYDRESGENLLFVIDCCSVGVGTHLNELHRPYGGRLDSTGYATSRHG